MILTGIAPLAVTRLQLLPVVGATCIDLDPRDGLSFTGLRSPSPLHGDVSEEHALAGQVSDPDHVVVVGDVARVSAVLHSNPSHSKAPPRCSNQRSTDQWDVSSLAAGHFIPSINSNRSK